MKYFSGALLLALVLILASTGTALAEESNSAFAGDEFEGGSQWLVVEMKLGAFELTDAVEVLWDANEDRWFLPLLELGRLLEFPIELTDSGQHVEGWFLARPRHIDIRFDEGWGEVDGKRLDFTEGDWGEDFGEIYIAADLLERWFPIIIHTDLRILQIEIEALESFPRERRLAREARLARMNGSDETDGPGFDWEPTPYQLIGIPVHDLDLATRVPIQLNDESAQEKGRISAVGRYMLRGAGDVLWMTGRWHISGSESDPLHEARVTLERRDPSGQIGGALGLTEVIAGDIRGRMIPLVAGGDTGRGVGVTNIPLSRPSHFDRTEVRGEIEPGWEVELYRNGTFIGVREASDEGTYAFDEVPLLFGWNELLLRFFGPYGEEKEETRQLLIGPGMIQSGEGYWAGMVQQHDRDVISMLGESQDTNRQGQVRATAQYEYGLTSHLSASGRVSTVALRSGEQRGYGSVGMQGVWKKLYIGSEAVADITNGWAAMTHVHTRLAGVNIVGEYQHAFGGFEGSRLGRSTRSHARLRLNGRILPGGSIPYQLRLDRRIRGPEQHLTEVAGRYSFRFGKVNFRHSLNGRWDQLGLQRGTSELRARFRWRRISPEFFVQSDLLPEIGATRAGARAGWSVSKNLSFGGNLSYHLQDESLLFGASVRGRIRGITWNIQARREADRFVLAAGISLGVGKNPHSDKWEIGSAGRTTTGEIVPRVFWDDDGSGEFGEDSERIEGASFVVNGSPRRGVETDADGGARVAGLRTDRFVDISVDEGGLSDSFALSTVAGRSVVPRPGVAAVVDFPVVMGGEVDGVVYLNGQVFRGACVELIRESDNDVAATTTAAFDGFYYFPQVRPGDYRVRICPDMIDQRGLMVEEGRSVGVQYDGTIVSNIDLQVRRPMAQQ